ncbi:uncharacterized protein LOC100142051 [Tribolium castaneum]|uniref:uncharacterized protein LOC100142051 n=1 Tax=Tribolium castaneum TaxID=7070 RepID=UPI00046C28E7|nr:PREDICTED: uncharacterized protein LOC103312611 [Tribolium castaneum]|eukprot:XP_008191885.1 PREDICTED: uncharacterized protein LOC103312611 [Tribolium castaneum]
MENEIFCKRKGSTDKGKLYEDLVTADLILKLLTEQNVNNFKLSSNNEEFGAFDDVVLKLDTGEIYALQLKHSDNNDKAVCEIDLTGGKNFKPRFDLKKYYESYKNIKVPCKVILFTNRTCDISDQEFPLNQNTTIKCLKCSTNPISLLNHSENGTWHTFEVVRTSPKQRDDYQAFFNNFYLFCGQANVEELRAKIIARFQETISCSKSLCDQFLQFVSSWSFREGEKEMLDKTTMQRVLVLFLLERSIQGFDFKPVNQERKLLQEVISLFHVTLIGEDSCEKVKQIWGDFGDEFENNGAEVAKIRAKYQIKSFDELDSSDKAKILWLMGKCPLVIAADNGTMSKVLQLCPNEKFVLLTSHENVITLEGSFFRNLSDLDLSSDICQKILRTFCCSIQGKDKRSLKCFVDRNKNFRENVTVSDLINMTDGPRLIGEEKEKAPDPYITRFLTTNLINIKYLTTVDENTLVVLDCMNKIDKIKRHLGNFNLHKVATYLKDLSLYNQDSNQVTLFHSSPIIKQFVSGPDMYVSEAQCTPVEFEEICQRNKNKEKCHHFRVIDEMTLEWIRSRKSITTLEQFRIDGTYIKESSLYGLEPENNVNLVNGDPGMGKSELLKNIKNNSNPEILCIFFPSKDTTLLCSQLEGKSDLYEAFVSFILNTKYRAFPSFDKKVIKFLIDTDQVMYFWDALDEVSTKNMKTTIDLIEILKGKSLCQWVSSRCHLKGHLEKKFNVLSRNINQFDEEEQSLYIHKRLGRLYSEDDINKVIEKIRSAVTLMKHNDILGIPLQVFMLTELFLQDKEKYFNLLKNMFSLADLYHYIIEEKFNVYYKEKAGISSPNDALERILMFHRKNMYENYEKAALKASITKEILKRFHINCDNFLKELETGDDNIGLIKEVTNSFPQFQHNSYAEYFVATYFIAHYEEIPELRSLLFDKRHANIRFFFDLLTAKDSPSLVAVLCKNIDLLKKHQEDLERSEDKRGRNALQLACSWGQRYPILEVEKDNGTWILDNTNDNTLCGETPEYNEILQYLLEHCNVTETCKLFNLSCVRYAEESDCLMTKLKILLKQNNKFSKLKNDKEGISILYYCTKFGYDEVIDLFEDLPFIRMKVNDFTLLHLAVECEQEKYLRRLLQVPGYQKTIDKKDKFGRTPLYLACQLGLYKIVELLIESGANVNYSTPLHIACLHAHDNIVKLLLKAGTDINATDSYNITPLHTASWNGHHTTVQILTANKNVEIDVQTSGGCTPLYVAARNKHDRVVELLIEAKANVNLAQKENVTPLMIASQEGHQENVKLLIQAGSDVNQVATTGESPLYVACQNGHDVVVEMLLEAGANTEAFADNGWSPVFVACQQGHVGVVQLLMKAHANLGIKDKTGRTPLMVAFDNRHQEIVKLLGKNCN